MFTRYFGRTCELLFEAWTTPEHVQQWWGCGGSIVTHCEMDLRVDGAWRIVMRMPDGNDHTFHGRYREVVRPNRLVYSECYDMPQIGNPEWLTTVAFDRTAGGTLVTHTILHKSREARDGHLQAGMEAGMIQALFRLEEHTAVMQNLRGR